MMDIAPLFPRAEILDLRLDFTLSTGYGRKLLETYLEKRDLDMREEIETLLKTPSLRRVVPSAIEIELTNRCLLKCFFCPHVLETGEIDADPAMVNKTLEEFHSIAENGLIIFSGYGEPFLWKPFLETLKSAAARYSDMDFLVETNGFELGEGLGRDLTDRGINNIVFMISLDSENRRIYEEWKSEDFYNDVVENVRSFAGVYKPVLSLATRRRLGLSHGVIVDFVKSEETYPHLAAFYEQWKDAGVDVNVTKFRKYDGQVKGRLLAETGPLKRFPCYHLERDIFIRADGTAPLCSMDRGGSNILGNISTSSLAEIWEAGRRKYDKHIQDPQSISICAQCDEWHVPTTRV